MMVRARPAAGLMALAIALIGCAEVSSTPSVAAAPLRGEARDGEFTLVITSPQAAWSIDEAITVQAQLTYGGAVPTLEISSAAGGVIGFSVFELTGNRRMDAIRDAACFPYTIGPDQPIITPYIKSGEINPGDSNEAFYKDFFADPLFHLPAGSWRVEAWAQLYVAGCDGRRVELRASLLLTVQ